MVGSLIKRKKVIFRKAEYCSLLTLHNPRATYTHLALQTGLSAILLQTLFSTQNKSFEDGLVTSE